jgi:hypothetical protein
MKIRFVPLVIAVVFLGGFAFADESRARPTTIIGFLDSGWPFPAGHGASRVPVGVALPAGRTCGIVLDSTLTDTGGVFRLSIPDAHRTAWRLCARLAAGGWARGAVPIYHYSGIGLDSLRLYCRGHGPAGSPECRYVAWGRPMRWPGGESYDSVPKPPNER